jgi:diguanylate cyclase (GGDEF)-like protein
MEQDITHEIELYLLEVFNTLAEHEVRNARRYKYPLSMICIAVHAKPDTPQTQHAAEMVAINALDAELRDTDIPCRNGHEFFVLLPSTDEKGAHHACGRLEMLLNTTDHTNDGTAFQMSAFIGLASFGDELVVSSKNLLDNARRAMEHAHTTSSLTTVLFSALK